MSSRAKLKTKEDTRFNVSDLDVKVEEQRKREKHLHPIRIDNRTVLLVSKKKCNNKHADEYRKKLDENDSLLYR